MIFGRFSGKKKKEDLPCAEKLTTAVERSIFEVVGARSIPTMPAAAQKAFQLSTDPNAEARDFVEVITSDEGLSARVIKIANSVYFDRGKHSTTIEESVLVIGINELRSLLSATTLSEIFASANPARALFWTHDIAVGLIGRKLARRFLPDQAELVFLCGLMHDIGKLLLVQRAMPSYELVLNAIRDRGISFVEAETEIFPFSHAEVGQLIGERWRFSPEVLACVRLHHAPLPSETVTLPGLIKVADLMAHSCGFGHPRGWASFQRSCEEQLPALLEQLGIPPSEHRELMQSARRTVETEIDLYHTKRADSAADR